METVRPFRVRELAAHVGGEVIGDPERAIDGVGGLEEAGPSQLSFFGNARYRKALDETRAGCVLVQEPPPSIDGKSFIRVANPHLAYAKVIGLFHPSPRPAAGVSERAFVHPEAFVDPSATVMAFVTVGKGAKVGARSVLHPGVYVGEGARIGEDCLIHPNVTVRERCVVGNRVVLQPNCVVGSDGFGFAFDPEGPAHVKVPQVGIVRIEDDVELGAGTCVDRATVGETVVGRGAKIDNLVQIAHNVKIGAMAILCAQVGISGSSEVGQGAVLAGQVGVVGHIRIGDLAKVGAQSGVSNSVPDGETVSGYPAVAHRHWLRTSAAMQKLPELISELRALRKRIETLEGEDR